MLLFLGLTLCVTGGLARIPPWSPQCPQHSSFPTACAYGNLKVTLASKTMTPADCNSYVDIAEFAHTPVIHIDTNNITETFTVVMIDLGPDTRGPNYLQWMVTNVTVSSLPNFNNIPKQNVIEGYKQPLLMKFVSHLTLVQILVFRHNNVLRINFGELWVKRIQNFSLSTLFSNTYPNLKLCGPVAATQYWLYDPNFTPSAPPAPGVQPLQPLSPVQPMQPQPVYVPVVPVVSYAPVQASGPGPIAPSQHKTFPKRSSAPRSQPMQILFIPIFVITVMCL